MVRGRGVRERDIRVEHWSVVGGSRERTARVEPGTRGTGDQERGVRVEPVVRGRRTSGEGRTGGVSGSRHVGFEACGGGVGRGVYGWSQWPEVRGVGRGTYGCNQWFEVAGRRERDVRVEPVARGRGGPGRGVYGWSQ